MSPPSMVGVAEDDPKVENGLENWTDFALYVKVTTQSSVFECEFPTAPAGRLSAAYAAQANGQAGTGLRYFSERAVCLRPSACARALCMSPDATERIPLN